jgi:hypothetical protein
MPLHWQHPARAAVAPPGPLYQFSATTFPPRKYSSRCCYPRRDGCLRYGRGLCVYDDGRVFVGEWRGDEWYGLGSLYMPEGCSILNAHWIAHERTRLLLRPVRHAAREVITLVQVRMAVARMRMTRQILRSHRMNLNLKCLPLFRPCRARLKRSVRASQP